MDGKRKVENLGKNIKYARMKISDMTQNEFAEAVNLSYEQIQKIEQGNSLPSVPSLFAIADFTGVPLDLLAKDDIKSSKLYSLLALMEEIDKYDDTFIDSTVEVLMSIYSKIRSQGNPKE